MPAAHLKAPPVVAFALLLKGAMEYRGGCTGKIAMSLAQAQAVIRRRTVVALNARHFGGLTGRHEEGSGHPYRCQHCGAFHTSHMREPSDARRSFAFGRHLTGSVPW